MYNGVHNGYDDLKEVEELDLDLMAKVPRVPRVAKGINRARDYDDDEVDGYEYPRPSRVVRGLHPDEDDSVRFHCRVLIF